MSGDLFRKFLAEAERAADLNKTLLGDPKSQPETFTDLILDIAVRQSEPSSRRPTATSLSYERRLILAALHIAIQDLRASNKARANAEANAVAESDRKDEIIHRLEDEHRQAHNNAVMGRFEITELTTKIQDLETANKSKQDEIDRLMVQLETTHEAHRLQAEEHKKETERQEMTLKALYKSEADLTSQLKTEEANIDKLEAELAEWKAHRGSSEQERALLRADLAQRTQTVAELVQSETTLKSTIRSQQDEIEKLKSIIDEHHLERTFMSTIRICLNEAENKAEAASRRAKELEQMNEGWKAKYEDVRDKLVSARQVAHNLLRATQDTVQKISGSNKRIKTVDPS
jgi:chromosome segregation ATPase